MRLFILLFAAVLLSAPLTRADEAEDAAVRAVEKLGGTVSRDQTAPGAPVVVASLDKTGVADRDLKGLAGLKQLRVLNLFGTGVTDAGLKELAALKDLQGLDLRGTKVTDRGLKVLAVLQRLESVFLEPANVTNAGVAALQKALPGCRIVR